MKTVDLTTDYEVAAGNVLLSIDIGDAQIGSSIVKLDQEELGRGDISELVVGIGPKIRGKALIIKSIVTDVNDSTNHTSITYKLKGGLRDIRYVSSATVDEDGDSIIYRAHFNLISMGKEVHRGRQRLQAKGIDRTAVGAGRLARRIARVRLGSEGRRREPQHG
jgi:hypothetical protein